MRKDRHNQLAKEPGLLGTLWNLVYGLFLMILAYGSISMLIIAFIGGVLLMFKFVFELIRAGAAIGFPYI